MSREAVRPYLVTKNEAGEFFITVRTTRFNSQGYPLISTRELEDRFPTVTKARTFLRSEYKAEAAEIATK